MNFSNKYAAIIFILAKVIVYKAYDELYLVQLHLGQHRVMNFKS